MMADLDESHPITLYPGPRGHAMLEHKSNIMNFSLFRTPEREEKYKWIGPLTDINDPQNIIDLTTAGFTSIFAGNTLMRQHNFSIPIDLSGEFEVEVFTNYNNATFENGLIANNKLLADGTLVILSAETPNLVAEEISITNPSPEAGETIEINYTISNQGATGTIGIWNDRVVLSTDPTLPLSSSIFLAESSQSQVILPGASYDKTLNVELPDFLNVGDYYLYVFSDVYNNIYEDGAEADNNIRSIDAFSITETLEVDLSFDGNPTGGINTTPGESSTIYYKVESSGNIFTPADNWYDGLYLSPNPVWDPDDILIAEWAHNGALAPGQGYEKLETFTLPEGLSNEFYLCLVIDHDNVLAESNENNNYFKLEQSNGDPVIVTYPPNPDLEVTSISVPAEGLTGQPIVVEYTIQNTSNSGNATGAWSDAIYLSTDQNLGPGDIFLGQATHSGGLLIGASYTASQEVTLPLDVSGNYFLLVQADKGNAETEASELNNTSAVYLPIIQPPPGDLRVISGDILLVPIDTIATDLDIEWTIINDGSNPLSGYMEQGIYLSEDQIWDAEDVLLGTWSGDIGLDPGTTVEHQLTARIEGVSRQDYYALVKTDLLDHFLETDEGNNCGVSPGTVFIEVPELPIGTPPTLAELPIEQPIYYRLEIAGDTIGETVQVSLTGEGVGTFNELYLRYNEVPTRTVHDFSFDQPFEPDQAIVIPATEGGTYYILAYAVEAQAIQNIELLAEIIPFQITSITSNQGGNTGSMTAIMEGAKFYQGMPVWLENPALGTIEAVNVEVVNSTKAFVTFPLDGATEGIYDVVSENDEMEQAALEDGFEITTGSIGNGPLIASCTFDFGGDLLTIEDVPGGLELLEFAPSHPAFVRPNQIVPITLRFENTGDIDVPVPTRIFSSLTGFPLASATDDLPEELEELSLVFTEEGGPRNVLRPGGVAFITVYSKATESEGVMIFQLISP